MPYYKICPVCGCNLDPGESCDCEGKGKPETAERSEDEDAQKKSREPETARSDNNAACN